MSDLRLPELARCLGKDARTTRRWCERGLIPGAYRTPGGHWRVKGDAAAVAGAAKRKARGFSRKRNRGAHQSPLAVFAESIPGSMASLIKGLDRMQRAFTGWRWRVMLQAKEEIYRRKSIFALQSWEELIQKPLVLRENARCILWGGLVAAMWEVHEIEGRCTRTALAQRFGVSRRAFGRSFGKVWREAQEYVVCVVHNGESTPDGEIDFAAMDSRNGWQDPPA